VAELRWILLGLGLLLIAGIWWRGARAGDAAGSDRDERDPRAGARPEPSRAPPDAPSFREPVIGEEFELPPPRERAVPPFEPLTIKTTDLEPLPIVDAPFVPDVPILADPDESPAAPTAPESPPPESAPPERSNGARMIVTLRICALGDARWSGRKLAQALEMQGLAYGRYQVFHRHHIDGQSLFSVASLREPGTFDPQTMPDQEFRGITMFAVLPGPLDPVQTVEAMIATSRRLAESLTGIVQDARGLPLSPQRAAALREEAARFHATLS
jgi:cell division protein ZipA